MSTAAETTLPKESREDMVETIEFENRDPAHNRPAEKDKAAELLEDAGGSVVLTPENNSRVLRKIDLRILPLVLGIYFLQALDKATLAYASVFGLIEETGLVDLQYSWLGSVVYLAQLVVQPVVAYLLVKMRLGKFLAISVFCWGAVLSCMPAAHNFPGLLVCRLFLGAFEAGVAPAFIAVTQMWYRRHEQPLRLGAWYAMNGITNMFGSLLTYGLGHIKSPHLSAYQIIFLFFGLITVAFAFLVLIFMPDSPMTTKFLDGEDKLVSVERLRMNQQGVENDVWKWSHVKEAFLDLKTWFWFCMMFSISIPSGGISTFGPLIVESFGYDEFDTILFNIPFGAVQLVATMGGAWLATVWKKKGPVLFLLSIPPIAGCVVLLRVPHDNNHKAALLVGYYLISVYPGITPLIYSWSAANTAGETKKKVTTGILFIGQCAGNVVGPTLYTVDEAPLYFRGLRSNLALFVVMAALYVMTGLYLALLNKKHGAKRAQMGKSRIIIDQSMQAMSAAQPDKEEGLAIREQYGGHAFDDLTDWQNEDFIYVY
ncbi:hypothetical protein FQN54_005881 [Arachnomyces sp. PD_36]|nr:hypothetical protein FQN54_005881 [Arachnomyces sp. PD_36]